VTTVQLSFAGAAGAPIVVPTAYFFTDGDVVYGNDPKNSEAFLLSDDVRP
jgi:hypothetical protein